MDALRRAVQTEQRKIVEEALGGSPLRSSWSESGSVRHYTSSPTPFSNSMSAGRSLPSRTNRLAVRAQTEASRSNSPLWSTTFPGSPQDRRVAQGQVAVWQGTLLEELGERPLVAQGRGGLLCARATERGACWGSLRSSWLAKNTFEEWRSHILKRHISEDRRVEIVMEPPIQADRTAEFERLLEAAERREAALRDELTKERDRQLEVVVDRLGREHVEQQRVIKEHLLGDLHGEFQRMREQLVGLREELCVELRSEAMHAGEFQRMREQLVGLREELCVELRRINEAASSTPAAFRDILDEQNMQRAVRESLEEAFNSGSPVMCAVSSLDRKLDRLERKVDFSDLKIQPDFSSVHSAIQESSRRVTETVQSSASPAPDHSPILEAIGILAAKVESDVMGAIRRIRFDNTPVLDAIKNQQVDHSEVLAAIRRIRLQPDFSPIYEVLETNQRYLMEAIDKFDQTEVSAAIRRLRVPVDVSQLQTALEVNHRSVMDAVKATRGDLKSELYDVLGAIRDLAQREIDKNEENKNKADGSTSEMNAVLHTVRDLRIEIGSKLNPLHDALHESHRDLRKEIGSKLTPLHDALHENHRQTLSAVENSKVDHSPVLEALRNIGHDYKMHLAPIHERLEANHRSIQERIEACAIVAPPTPDDEQAAKDRCVEIVMEPPIQADRTAEFERVLEAGQLQILEAIEALKIEHCLPQIFTELRDALRVDLRQISEMQGQIVQMQEEAELLKVHETIRASREETVRDVVAAIETAVDHSPLLTAIGSFQLKGQTEAHAEVLAALKALNAEVLAALKALRLDLNMEPDFSPVLHALRELPSAAEQSQLQSSIQKIRIDLSSVLAAVGTGQRELIGALEALAPQQQRSLSPASTTQEKPSPGPARRRKYIVTLGEAAQANGALEHITAGMAGASPLPLGHNSYLVDSSG